MNPRRMLELAKLQQKFKKNHPKVFPFLKVAAEKGSVVDISVTTPEGKVMRTNLRIKPEDMEIVEQLKQMRKNG